MTMGIRLERIFPVAALCVLVATAAKGDDALNPHRMTDAHGKADLTRCATCHTDTLGLARSKRETCTLCHSETVHSGAAEHLRADRRAVTAVMNARDKSAPALPLDDDGRIYCGTCHLFHDPALSGEKPLTMGRAASTNAVGAAVADGVRDSIGAASEGDGRTAPSPVRFVAPGSTALRAPVADGTLCLSCHRSYAP
jgi:hypothetical protein